MSKLTVAEYAELHKISVQAVYKRIDKLKTVEEERNGRKIRLIIENEEQEPPANDKLNPDSTPLNPELNPKSTPLNPDSTEEKVKLNPNIQPPLNPDSTPTDPAVRLIEILQEQLKEKDKQIERLQEQAKEKDKQIQEQFERLTTALIRAQELEARTQALLGQPEEQPEPETIEPETVEEQEQETEQETVEEPEAEEQPKKRSFFQWLLDL